MERDNEKRIEEIERLEKYIEDLVSIASDRDKAKKVADDIKEAILIAKELAEEIIDAVRDPLVVLNADLRVLSVNNAFYKTFHVKSGETIGKLIYDVGNRQWDIPKLRKLLEDILPTNSTFNDYVIEHDFPNIGKRTMILNARCIPRLPAKPKLILLAIADITEIDRLKLIAERMFEKEILSKLAKEKFKEINELKKEVDALLAKLGEKLKYNK